MTAANAKPRAGEHTKGPWKVCERAYNNAWHVDVTIYRSLSDNTPYRIADVSLLNPEFEANARRIVACVNACEGLSNEFLDAAELQKIVHGAADLAVERDALKALNGELVEALEGCAADIEAIYDLCKRKDLMVVSIGQFRRLNATCALLAKAR